MEEVTAPRLQTEPVVEDPDDKAETWLQGNPALKAAKIIAALLVTALIWHAISDRFTPTTTRGDVAAYVAQVAPRVSGRVT